MAVINYPKYELIESLWLPMAEKAKAVIRPRRKQNFDLKLFTLSDGISFSEVDIFESHDLLKKSDVVAWTFDLMKKCRADTEGFDAVIDGDVYNDFSLADDCPLRDYFPFDMINLDFTTQPPPSNSERIKGELENLEKCLNLQNQGITKFLLIYTTYLDEIIAVDLVRQFSGGDLFDTDICSSDEKRRFIREAIVRLASQNDFNCMDQICSDSLGLNGGQEIYSVVQILKK